MAQVCERLQIWVNFLSTFITIDKHTVKVIQPFKDMSSWSDNIIGPCECPSIFILFRLFLGYDLDLAKRLLLFNSSFKKLLDSP